MMKTLLLAAFAALLPLLAPVRSVPIEDPSPPPAPTVRDLAWLSGSWSGTGFGGETDEQWSAPRGGTLLGWFRLVQDGRTAMTLYMVVEDEEDGAWLRFQHFGPGYTPWEEHANRFRLVALEGRSARFECPDEEQALRSVTYDVDARGRLEVEVTSREEDGSTSAFELVFERDPDTTEEPR